MAQISINTEKCKGCALCTYVCPQKIIIINNKELNAKGYHPVSVIDMDKCTGCAFCATICPDCAIEVRK